MKFRKFLTGTLAATLIASNLVMAAPAPKLDTNAAYAPATQRLYSLEVIKGKNDEVGVAAEDTLTRAELYQILLTLKGVDIDDYADVDAGFEDTTGWNAKVANAAKALKMTDGVSATEFAPDAKVEHIVAVAALLKTLGFNEDIQGIWGAQLTKVAADKGIALDIDAVGAFDAIKRGNVFYLVSQALDVKGADGKTLFDSIVDAKKLAITEVTGVAKAVDGKVEINGTTYTVLVGSAADLNGKKVVVKVNADKEILAVVSAVAIKEATKVEKVSSTNLKQVTVKFDGPVDKDTAEDKGKYKIDDFSFSVAKLVDDTTVVLTLEDGKVFENQKGYKLTVDGVKGVEGTVIAKAEKVEFTSVDVAIPTVKEIKALGTKALKITFSEPIKSDDAMAIGNYKIDGKSIIGVVRYNEKGTQDYVIIETTMTTGDHKLDVSDVKDFANFKVSEKELPFTVAEDTQAPEIVEIKGEDLKKVVITFNEPVKSIGKVYHTSSGKEASKVEVDDNKVTATFSDDNKLPATEVTVYAKDVEDWSGNKADRSGKVTAELDTKRPEVKEAKHEIDGDKSKFTIEFSKDVNVADATKKANYTIKKDGKAVTGNGLDQDGHPITAVSFNEKDKKAEFKLSGKLDTGKYTLEIEGIRDLAAISNTMLPKVIEFEVGDTKAPEIADAWFKVEDKDSNKKKQVTIYVRFTKEMAIEGKGNVLDASKYDYATGGSYKPLPKDATITLETPTTVKVTLPEVENKDYQIPTDIKVKLVSDKKDNFLSDLVASKSLSNIDNKAIALDGVKAIAKDKVEAKFKGELTTIDAKDFQVVAGTEVVAVNIDSYKYDDGNTIIIFKLAKELTADRKIGAEKAKLQLDPARDTTTNNKIATKDHFGVKVKFNAKEIDDAIAPEVTDTVDKKAFEVKLVNGEAVIFFNTTEEVKITNAAAKDVVQVKIAGETIDVARVDAVAGAGINIILTQITKADVLNKIKADSIIEVSLKDVNSTLKYIQDKDGDEALAKFAKALVLEASGKTVVENGKPSTTTPTNPTEPTDAEKIEAAAAELTLPTTPVTTDLTLLTSNANGATIAWTSSNAAVVSNTGVITRPAAGAADAEVTLTATVTSGTATAATKTFTVKVKAQDPVAEPTIVAANVETQEDMKSLITIKVDFPQGITNVKVIEIDGLTLTKNNEVTSGSFRNFPGDYAAGNNKIKFEYTYNGATKTVEVTK